MFGAQQVVPAGINAVARNVLGAIFFAVLASSPARGQVPRSPVDPTYADCQALGKLHARLLSEYASQVRVCMEGPAHIGIAQDVASDCSLYRATRAWPQCTPLQVNECKFSKESQAEFSVCYQRARAREQREKEANRATASNDEQRQALARKYLKQYNDTVGLLATAEKRIRDTRSFLSNPKRFVFNALLKGSQVAAFRLFDPDGLVRRTAYGDVDEIYKFADMYARAGIGTDRYRALGNANPIIRSIQSSAFDAIGQSFKRSLAELDGAIGQIHSFGTDASPAPRPLAIKSLGNPVDSGCAVLNDQDASGRLMASNESEWLKLVARCK